MFKELFTEAKSSKYAWKGGSKSDTEKIEKLISGFDFYSHMIDDYSKEKSANSKNKDIKQELKEFGVTEISFKDGSEKRNIESMKPIKKIDLHEIKNLTELKELMKKEPGFNSWTFEGDYETLVIGFKTNKQAIDSYIKYSTSKFGKSVAKDSKITIELYNEHK